MPIAQHNPYWFVEYSSMANLDHKGEPLVIRIYPEDILPMMVQGWCPVEIANYYQVPPWVIEHCIMDSVPRMMAWRRELNQQAANTSPAVSRSIPVNADPMLLPREEPAPQKPEHSGKEDDSWIEL